MKLKVNIKTQDDDKPPSWSLNPSLFQSLSVPPKEPITLESYFLKQYSKQQKENLNKNVVVDFFKSLRLKIETQIDVCQDLWKEFAPCDSVFNTWDFRYAFWYAYQYELYFIVLKNESENLAVLPLCFDKDEKKYFWFGGLWPEDNTFFVKKTELVPLLFSVCPSPALLNTISLATFNKFRNFVHLEPDDPKYILDLQNLNNSDDFLAKLKKKRRYNLRRDKKIIEKLEPKIVYDNYADFKHLVGLSKNRFRLKGEHCDWEDPRRIETFKKIIDLGVKNNNYKVRIITVIIGNKIASVDLILIFNNCYAPIKCGYNVKDFPGIGNFVNLLEIDDAISLEMKTMDFLEVNYGWKDKWFRSVPLFKFEKS